jgi:hypothetical protein
LKKKFFLIFIFFFILYYISSNEKDLSEIEKRKLYEEEKIGLVIKEEFDVMYPANIKLFEFYKGGDQISLNDFVTISNDPLLLRNQQKLKKIRIAGFTSIGVLGGVTLSFLIPSTIFVVSMTNNMPIDDAYILTGIFMVGLTSLSFLGLIIDLAVTFSLLHKFRYNEYSIRQAVENYNENLRKKLGILPDISFNSNSINIGINIKL